MHETTRFHYTRAMSFARSSTRNTGFRETGNVTLAAMKGAQFYLMADSSSGYALDRRGNMVHTWNEGKRR